MMKIRVCLALAALVLVAMPAFAQQAAMTPKPAGELKNLESGFPAQMITTATDDQGKWVLGFEGTYTNEGLTGLKNGKDFWSSMPQVSYGILPNLEVFARWPIIFGQAEFPGNGDTTLALRGRINDETDVIPSFGLQVAGRIPTGAENTDCDGTITAIATKSFGDLRLSVNAGLTTIGNNVTASNSHTDSYVIGADYPVMSNVLLVSDFVTNQDPFTGERNNLFEVGVRSTVTEVDIVSAGVGIGIGHNGGVRNDVPAWTATVGYQRLL